MTNSIPPRNNSATSQTGTAAPPAPTSGADRSNGASGRLGLSEGFRLAEGARAREMLLTGKGGLIDRPDVQAMLQPYRMHLPKTEA